jgi:hypothetical protein
LSSSWFRDRIGRFDQHARLLLRLALPTTEKGGEPFPAAGRS